VREGAELRYDVKIAGGRTAALTLLVESCEQPWLCAGRMSGDALGGSWSWSYSERGGLTRVTYESELNLAGLLRFAGAVIERELRSSVRGNLANPKTYVEAGMGPAAG